ncbi:TetR/AcrR family transcriptional regulator [Kineococcus rhizosphaerae]|uniref:TetR family transcriptional regulator n=1 Tax=Kineococcus rhizosphaerae TaxID=559628 RepID=A0A2T0QUQ7_9ACTN|nr:TetR/AcrR family transcriptional regulator [Kineococcus rhizosphaerae]PRY08822.1 TetR family transcriptional regulator [Kineococcus rhizosphaerae]
MPRTSAEQRRKEFVTAAVKVIAEKGIEGATTRRIAAEAGASLATLHYCYDSKEELFHDIFENMANAVRDSVWHVAPGCGLGRAAATLLRQLMGWYLSEETYARAQSEVFYWGIRQHPEAGMKYYSAFFEVVEEHLIRGLRDDDDRNLVPILTHMVFAAADGLLPQWLAHGDPTATAVDIDTFAEAFERLTERRRP